MRVVILACICVSLSGVYAPLPFPSDRTNQKKVEAACTLRKDNSLLMKMGATFGGNNVDKFLALPSAQFQRYANGTTNEVPCTYTGNILTDGGIQVESVVRRGGSLQDINPCGATPLQISGNVVGYQWYLQIREKFNLQVYTDIDRTYRIVCSFADAFSNAVTAHVQVYIQGEDSGTAEAINPDNDFYVVVDGNTVDLNENVRLRIQTFQQNNRQSSVHHYGLYPYECDYRYHFTDAPTIFIDPLGCPVPNNIFQLSNGFRYARYVYLYNQLTRQTQRAFQTETDLFVLAREKPPNDIIYLSCYINYCFGVEGSDAKCTNYCNSASASGRKKRSTQLEAEKLTIAIRISEPNATGTNAGESNASDTTNRTTLIAVASTVCVVVLFSVVLAVFVVCCICRRQDDELDEKASSTNSMKHLPVDLNPEHFRAAKF